MAISNIMVMLGSRLIYRRFEGEKRSLLFFFPFVMAVSIIKEHCVISFYFVG